MTNRYDSVLIKLDQDKRRGKVTPLLLQFYKRLMHIQGEAEQRMVTLAPAPSSDIISQQLQNGIHLLQFDQLPLDWSLLKETSAKVIAAFAEYPELFGKLPQDAEKPDALLTKESLQGWYEGSDCISSSDILVDDIIHATLKPFLSSYSRTLIGSINQENWRRGYCPICGGNPDIALLKGENGARWLVCSRCDAEWLFQRLECPYCGNKNMDKLGYYTDDEGLFRLYTCEECKRYLKTLDTRRAKSEILMPVERLFSLDIDRQGQELGYSPCGGKAQTDKPES